MKGQLTRHAVSYSKNQFLRYPYPNYRSVNFDQLLKFDMLSATGFKL